MCIWFNLFLQRLPEVNELRNIYNHSHKKRKNSLEGSLDQVLFAAELKFPRILVPTLPQNASNVNIECAGICLHFIILILICF